MFRRVSKKGLTCALLVAATVAACKRAKEPTGKSVPFEDKFDRQALGDDWTYYGGDWTIDRGNAYTTIANNIPLFLNVDLPHDVVVEVDVKSETTQVDAKIELMTDGRKHQSGYVFILGGWKNAISVIARLDEHGKDRKELSPTGVKPKTWYRWRIEKKGGELKWYLDGKLYMSFQDPEPLEGPGHNRLALSNWQNKVRYDNLSIWKYENAPKTSTVGAAHGTR